MRDMTERRQNLKDLVESGRFLLTEIKKIKSSPEWNDFTDWNAMIMNYNEAFLSYWTGVLGEIFEKELCE